MADIFFVMKSSKKLLKVHQMSNNWITATEPDLGYPYKGGQPVNPRVVRFEGDNIKKVVAMHKRGQLAGMFRDDYDLEHFKKTGEFKRQSHMPLPSMMRQMKEDIQDEDNRA